MKKTLFATFLLGAALTFAQTDQTSPSSTSPQSTPSTSSDQSAQPSTTPADQNSTAQNPSTNDQSAMSSSSASQTLQGCASGTDNFTDQATGKSYKLSGNTSDLSSDNGKTVQLTGSIEADNSFKVDSVKMISDSCQSSPSASNTTSADQSATSASTASSTAEAPAVSRSKDPARLVRSVRMSQDRDEQRLRVLRIDDDLRDLLAVAQTVVRPRLAGVGGLVDAVARREIGALKSFTAPDVDDVGIRRRDGDGANRAGRLVVEDGRPGTTKVVRLPDAAVDGADVEDVRLIRDADRGLGAARAMRADHAPAHLAVHVWIDLR